MDIANRNTESHDRQYNYIQNQIRKNVFFFVCFSQFLFQNRKTKCTEGTWPWSFMFGELEA